jgi:hypothetical protein
MKDESSSQRNQRVEEIDWGDVDDAEGEEQRKDG